MKVFSPSPREGDGIESRWNWQGRLRGMCTRAFYRILLGDLWGFVHLPWERRNRSLVSFRPCPQLSRGTKSLAIHSHWHREALSDYPAAEIGTSITRSLLFLPHYGIVAWRSIWLGHISQPPSASTLGQGTSPRWSTKVTQGRANISHLLPCPTACLQDSHVLKDGRASGSQTWQVFK